MSNSQHEYSSTYFVQDLSSQAELTRLQILGQMTTAGMGGVLPEQHDPTYKRILDVGCGIGEWLIAAASTYPHITRLVGVDISSKMINYARTQAQAQQLNDRVEFHIMDALRLLEFPDDSFDLVNQRLAQGWMRTWDWPKLLGEFQRVVQPGGLIRLTESNFVPAESNSPALNRLNHLLLQTLHQAGNYFTPTGDGIASHLAPLLQRYGVQNVQTRTSTLHFRPGTPEAQRYVEEQTLFFQNTLPFISRWTRVPDDYEAIYQQMLTEIQQPDFVTSWNIVTAWGTCPN